MGQVSQRESSSSVEEEGGREAVDLFHVGDGDAANREADLQLHPDQSGDSHQKP